MNIGQNPEAIEAEPVHQNRAGNIRAWSICALLALATLIAYQGVFSSDFVFMDDPYYVTENSHVQAGLTEAGVDWAFTSREADNWHPLTWISLMLDRDLFGPGPAGFHVTNLALHILNAAGLFWLLRCMTGATGRSAFVAALFALHPLHVESVAWVSERKDVLSAFLGILTLWAYVRFARKPTSIRYISVLCLFALGLMAKPMLVTLPCLLLLLDIWPLKRVRASGFHFQDYKPLLQEKIPLFVMSAVSCLITIWAQQKAIGIAYPLQTRALNAAWSYARYIFKMFFPERLYVNYPYPQGVPIWYPLAAAAVIGGLTWMVIRQVKMRPQVFVGWFWFLISLVPVVGLVQVGIQSMADRYTYIPLIGLFIIVAWVGCELLERTGLRPFSIRIIAIAIAATCMSMTWTQAGYWNNSLTLFHHALRLNPNNFFVEVNLALAYEARNNHKAAEEHLVRATEINPYFGESYNKLGWVQSELEKYSEAVESFNKALKYHGNPGLAHYGMAVALEKLGRLDEAEEHIQSAMMFEPGNQEDINEYNLILEKKKKIVDSLPMLR